MTCTIDDNNYYNNFSVKELHNKEKKKDIFYTVLLIVFGIMRPPESRAQSEIREFNVPIAINEYVVGFYVAMNESHFMHALDGARQLGNVKSSQWLAKDAKFYQQRHQITTGYIIHHEVKIVLVLKGVVKLNDPLVIGLGQYVPLGLDVSHLIPIQHVRLPQRLHRVKLIRVEFLDERHLAKSTHANWLDLGEH